MRSFRQEVVSGNLRGGAFADLLNGDTAANRIEGLDGDDQVNAGDGADTVDGGAGRDTLSGDAGDDTLDGVRCQLEGIVGFALPIARLEGKWKMSQNRPAADRAGVVEGLGAEGRDEVAALVPVERS